MCSIVEYYGDCGKSSCGYCKGNGSSESSGMTAHFLSVEDYQDLIDRGWRRSGKYCYKPSNNTTCCPSYTIKCDLQEFVLSKSHKKILKTMNKFLKDGVKSKDGVSGPEGGDGDVEDDKPVMEKEYLKSATRDLPSIKMETQKETPEESSRGGQQSEANNTGPVAGTVVAEQTQLTERHQGNPKKKKLMRLERRQARLASKGLSAEPVAPLPVNASPSSARKTLDKFLNEEPKDGKHKLKVILVPSNSTSAKESFDLYTKYQVAVHLDPPGKSTPQNYQRFLCTSPLKVDLVLSSTKEFKAKHGQIEFRLFQKYQQLIHNDKVGSICTFYNFLVDTPLKPEDTDTEHTLGSFHQQYWLDDKLIAVAVIDILPSCISSVYFFYDPEYKFLSLGTYSSLREIAFAQQLHRDLPELGFYYMGFYIHSCPKMRYKAKLTASFLLCPEAYTWHRITEELLQKLDRTKYFRFNADPSAKDANDVTQEDLKRIPMYNDGKPIVLEQYLRKCKDPTVFVRAHEYAKYVGRKCARRIVLYLM